MSVPADLKYTTDHEWTLSKDGAAGAEMTIGITAFAVEQLGDITLVNLDVKAGDVVVAGKTFGTIESVKTLSDLLAPISGKIVKVNADLENKPELVNEDAYGKGWMVVIAPKDGGETGKLMDAKAYGEFMKAAAH